MRTRAPGRKAPVPSLLTRPVSVAVAPDSTADAAAVMTVKSSVSQVPETEYGGGRFMAVGWGGGKKRAVDAVG